MVWVKGLYRKQALLFTELFTIGTKDRKRFSKSLDINMGLSRKVYQDIIYWKPEELEKLRKQLLHKESRTPGYIRSLLKKGYTLLEELAQLAREISDISKKDLREKSDRALLKYFFKYIDKFLDIIPTGYIPHALQSHLENSIKGKLKRTYRKEKTKKISNILFRPFRYSDTKLERRSMARLAIQIKSKKISHILFTERKYKIIKTKYPEIYQKIRNYMKNFAWMGTRGFLGKPWTEEEIIARIRETLRYRSLEELHEEFRRDAKEIKRSNDLLKRLKLSSRDKYYIRLIQELVFYQIHRADRMHYSDFLITNLLKEIARRRNLTFKELTFLKKEEILNYKITPTKKEIHNRIQSYGMITEKGSPIQYYFGKEVKRLAEKILPSPKEEKIIKGTTARVGKVRGTVKVVIHSKEIAKVKKEDILVTFMTTPTFIPALEKVKAIITDEGGILCHAAIISRELGLPCIIGTKIATKVLRDGDKVEVDADKGIVKILSQAK